VVLGGSARSVAAGGKHTCALLDTGAVRCWGQGSHGQLGYGAKANVGDDETPASAGDVALGGSATSLAAGSVHTCALLSDGGVRCWGNNGEGALGNGAGANVGDDERPDAVAPVTFAEPVRQIAASSGSTCALLASGRVQCWGSLRGTSVDRLASAQKYPSVELGFDAVALYSGPAAASYCATSKEGRLRCWGDLPRPTVPWGKDASDPGRNEIGVHVNGGAVTASDAGDLQAPGGVTKIALTAEFGCLLAAGQVRCWGNGDRGVLGSPQSEVLLKDAVAVELAGPATDIAVGSFHACAVREGGHVKCWGVGNAGQLGYGDKDNVGDKRLLSAVGNSL
jgi:alpha-tubulin suppressor-like RCC1 family protein